LNYRWEKLSSQEKTPFNYIAEEDRKRFENECNLYKQNKFTGRSLMLKLKHEN